MDRGYKSSRFIIKQLNVKGFTRGVLPSGYILLGHFSCLLKYWMQDFHRKLTGLKDKGVCLATIFF